MGLNGLLVPCVLGENCPRSRLCGRAVSVCAAVSLVRLLARRVCLCVSWRFRVRPSGKFSLSGTLCRRSRSSSTLSLTVDGNLSIPHLFSSLQPFHRVEALQWRLQRQQLTLPWRPYFSRRARRWRRFTSRQSPLDEKRPEKDWHRWMRSPSRINYPLGRSSPSTFFSLAISPPFLWPMRTWR